MRVARGLTWTELLAILVILFILLGFLMPAMQAWREVSRKFTCRDNLKRLGLALQNDHSHHNHFPAAVFGTESNQHRLSGLLALTEYLEPTESSGSFNEWNGLANSGKFSSAPVPWDENYELWTTTHPGFRCLWDESREEVFGRTNYAFNVGDQVVRTDDEGDLNHVRGFASTSTTLRIEDITDGLSNTIAIIEIGTKQGRAIQGQFAVMQPPSIADMPSICRDLKKPYEPPIYPDNVLLSDHGRGGVYADGSGGYSLCTTILPPNSPSCAIGSMKPYRGIFSAGSYHIGGCHIVMADASVKYMVDGVDVGDLSASSPTTVLDEDQNPIASPYGLWGALGTRASNENIIEML